MTEIEKQLKFYQALMRNSLDGICIMNISGDIVEANEAFCNMLGYNQEEVSKLNVVDWDSQYSKAELLTMFKDLVGSSARFETVHRRKDGQLIDVEISTASIDIEGQAYFFASSRDITERKKTDSELKEYQHLLRQLAAQGSATRDAELKHLAREVHDELGQLLTALRMDLSLQRIKFGVNDPALMVMVKNMLELVDKAIAAVRDVTSNLRPSALDMGIVDAIRWLAEEFFKHTHVLCSVSVVGDMNEVDESRMLPIFRIVQESLTNIARHAQATRVEIDVKKCDDGICIGIRDDGTGFDATSMPAKKSFGLMGIKERALAAGGQVEIDSFPGRGTLISVDIPLLQTKLGRRSND